MARIETHVEHLIADVADLRVSFARLDAKMDHGFARLDVKMDAGFVRIDDRFARMDAKIDRHFLILGGMIVTTVTTLAGLMAKGFHWL